MSYQCPRCETRGKTWEGSDPRCAFDESGVFLTDNWMCATMDELRDRTKEGTFCHEDTRHGLIALDGGVFVALCWYKNRGRTGTAIIMDDEGHCQPLDLATAHDVLNGHDISLE